MDDNGNAVELLNLRKRYGAGPAVLDGLTLSVERGKIFGFIGLNGAGKTTTIRIMAGLLPADSGETRLFGERVVPGGGGLQGRIGYVLDEPMYFEWMSAREYLLFAAGMYGMPEQTAAGRAGELLDVLELTGPGEAPIGSFSTGMKKKVSLAAAIIHHPGLLVLDEPFDGLDAVIAHAFKRILRRMAGTGTTVFVTSHALETIERLCDSVAVIHKGKIVMECATKDVREKAVEVLGSSRSLEELFVGLVTDSPAKDGLSWL